MLSIVRTLIAVTYRQTSTALLFVSKFFKCDNKTHCVHQNRFGLKSICGVNSYTYQNMLINNHIRSQEV